MTQKNILITGAMASGKSTVAALLKSSLSNAVLVPEPFEDNPFLPLYAQDQKRWAFTCQTYYFHDYVTMYKKTREEHPDASIFLIDAGAPTNLMVYGKYMKDLQVVTEAEGKFFDTLTSLINDHYQYPQPDICINVRASTDICYERLKERGRAFEVEGHTKEYIETITRYSNEMATLLEKEGVHVIYYDTQTYGMDSQEGKTFLLDSLNSFLQ